MTETIRRWIAVTTLGTYAVVEAWGAWAWHSGPWHAPRWPSVIFAVFSASLLVAMAGVHYRQVWARWLALGAGVTGLTNTAVLLYQVTPTYSFVGEALLFGAMPLALVLCLSGRRMAVHFTETLPARSIWHRHDDLRVRLLSMSIVTAIAAVAMMLVFGIFARNDTVIFLMATSAMLFGAGALLTAAERVAGVMFTGAAAIAGGFVAFGLADIASRPTFCGFSSQRKWAAAVAYPAIFLAAVTALLASAAFAPPMWRFLRRAPR